jgi:hypothetical protein
MSKCSNIHVRQTKVGWNPIHLAYFYRLAREIAKLQSGSGKEAFLALAGVWRDDPDIELIVQEAHRRRGRISVE